VSSTAPTDANGPAAAPEAHPLQPATAGAGAFLQRDYWAVIDRCRFRPSEVVSLVACRFPELPPPDLVVFERSDEGSGPLEVGDEFEIRIRLAGPCRVRVIHVDACSFTLGTLAGHPEAGRITFGAYRNDRGDVIFHVRSRARSGSLASYLGFQTGGDPMQTTTWTDLVDNVALTCGEGVIGYMHADTLDLDLSDLEPGDEQMDRPTFVARGD
jgi:hypothetical protein